MTKYSFVLDADGKPLSPTKEAKAWYMIRIGKVRLVSKYPMTIQLRRIISNDEICSDEVRCGIDDGAKHVGIALVQRCKNSNKVILKGCIELRNDVKHLISKRQIYRHYRRQEKRHRCRRFLNRIHTKRHGWVAPSIRQKKESILRVIKFLLKRTKIDSYYLEDVAIDIRTLTDGYKQYVWKYQKSNRLDENIRKATILRDKKCRECGKRTGIFEVHHILPRRLNGSNTINNLITLCPACHQKTKGKEETFMEHFYSILNVPLPNRLDYAEHTMIGKTYLRNNLQNFGVLNLTTGGDTANRRIDFGIEKSHSNDAICITDLKPDSVDIIDWYIKPIRKKSKATMTTLCGFKHRDIVSYTYRNGETHIGYVTALRHNINTLNFQSPTKHCKSVNAKKCKFVWRFDSIYWLVA